MTQNRSHAVMAQNYTAADDLSFFPTPAWGTRALCEYVLRDMAELTGQTVWEPACGEGHMARPLGEYFGKVLATDIHPYGYGAVLDFLTPTLPARIAAGMKPIGFIITNPPFNKAEAFAIQALQIARQGVALLCRISWFESEKREAFFEEYPCAIYAPFIGRLPMFKGRLDRKGSTATAYAWFVWQKGLHNDTTRIVRIPTDAKQRYDRDTDWAPLAQAAA